jgi:predicted Zn-dependent protease
MKHRIIILLTVLCFCFISCVERVPITGRKQVSLVNETELVGMSLTEYQTFLKQHHPLPITDARTQLVKRVGEKIAASVKLFMKEQGLSDRIKDYQWEFNAVDEATVNAWCMPGGKVVVYSGLLPVTQDEPSLAIVMGHEIAHAIARHGNERMSQQMIAQGLGAGLQIALSQKPKQTQDIFLQSYGVAATLGLLKYSRVQESEADKMGLVFAAMSGYDPHVAVGFWQRMADQSKEQPWELLSTHPSDATRVEDIKAYMPEAMKYYDRYLRKQQMGITN